MNSVGGSIVPNFKTYCKADSQEQYDNRARKCGNLVQWKLFGIYGYDPSEDS